MTSRPRLATDVNYVNGVGAVLLFVVLAYVFLTAGFRAPLGFGQGSITASIGYAMFDMVDQADHASESFLVAFEIIDVVLVAALVGAVMLARREEDGSVVTAIATDGGFLRSNGDGADGADDARNDDGNDTGGADVADADAATGTGTPDQAGADSEAATDGGEP